MHRQPHTFISELIVRNASWFALRMETNRADFFLPNWLTTNEEYFHRYRKKPLPWRGIKVMNTHSDLDGALLKIDIHHDVTRFGTRAKTSDKTGRSKDPAIVGGQTVWAPLAQASITRRLFRSSIQSC